MVASHLAIQEKLGTLSPERVEMKKLKPLQNRWGVI